MRKLNQVQKEKIMKRFVGVANIVIRNVEKYGNEKETLENDIDFAYDLMLEKAE